MSKAARSRFWEVMNLYDGGSTTMQAPTAAEALMNAYLHAQGNHNTWTWKDHYPKLRKQMFRGKYGLGLGDLVVEDRPPKSRQRNPAGTVGRGSNNSDAISRGFPLAFAAAAGLVALWYFNKQR